MSYICYYFIFSFFYTYMTLDKYIISSFKCNISIDFFNYLFQLTSVLNISAIMFLLHSFIAIAVYSFLSYDKHSLILIYSFFLIYYVFFIFYFYFFVPMFSICIIVKFLFYIFIYTIGGIVLFLRLEIHYYFFSISLHF